MSRRFAVSTAALAAPLLVGCGVLGGGVAGSGVAATETRPAAAFTAISASTGVQVVVEPGETDGLTVTADDNLLPLLVTEVDGDTLTVRFRESVRPRTPARVEVTTPALAKIAASSAASVTANDLDADALAVDAGSGAYVSVGGYARSLAVTAGSGAEVDAAGLAAGAVTVDAGSGATAAVNAAESLTVSASSGANVAYTASPGVAPDVTTASGASAGPAR